MLGDDGSTAMSKRRVDELVELSSLFSCCFSNYRHMVEYYAGWAKPAFKAASINNFTRSRTPMHDPLQHCERFTVAISLFCK
jgi:hypothetical protein